LCASFSPFLFALDLSISRDFQKEIDTFREIISPPPVTTRGDKGEKQWNDSITNYIDNIKPLFSAELEALLQAWKPAIALKPKAFVDLLDNSIQKLREWADPAVSPLLFILLASLIFLPF
jgi:hypothetical protein